MKKAILLVTVLSVLIMAFSLTAQAAAAAIGEVGVPYAKTAPTLDGVLGSGEWTGGKTSFSKDTATLALSTAAKYDTANFTFKFDCYYAWDEDYLYIAWDMQGENMWFDLGGNYVRLYLDPGSILNDHSVAQSNEGAGAMPRLVAAVKEDGSGVFGAQQLGVANVDYTNGQDYGLTLKANNKGWIVETRISWDLLEQSMAAKTVNPSVKVTPAAGYTIRANYDCYHVTPDKSNTGFLTTSMEQESIATNVWNFSKYADIRLVLQAEKTESSSNDGGNEAPDTGIAAMIPAVICLASASCVFILKKKR